ncbi:MAG: uncharacterized protein QOJ07_2108 [Thermoleophilaceae bacterium]|jgi:fermentation-respiration switch protein FrsA (DUF1100 family)|nr:uncharacterized protein [Thermoleophilaceae bacterium]
MAAREDVTFESGGIRCAAWLYRPGRDPGGRAPCVVLAHGFAGVREARLDAYAERFAAAGFAALVFDYRFFGASEGEPRQVLDIAAQLDDWRAAIAYARTLDGVDPDRIVAWGSSFSGGHVAAIAAEDERLAAAISQGPFVDGIAVLKSMGPRNAARLTAAGLRDEWARLRGRAPVLAPAVGPPGTLAAMNSPDAEPGYRKLFPPGYAWRNEVAGRVFLRVGLYRPGTRSAAIGCPWLVCIQDDDVVTPPEPAIAACLRAPRGELRRYPGGHFDIYVGEGFERSSSDQVEFLARHVSRADDRATAGSAS